MKNRQCADGASASTQPIWQPGWETAEDLQTEWHERHGWASIPPDEVVAQWALVQQAQDEYYGVGVDSGPQCTVGAEVPETLIVPAHPQFGELEGHIAVEMCRLSTGQPVVVAFTTVAGLVEALGQHQPWLQLPGESVANVSTGILLIDPSRGVLQQVWTKERLESLREALDD